MPNCAPQLAIDLDRRMIENHTRVLSPYTPDDDLPPRRGSDLETELGGRLLVRYLRRNQVEAFDSSAGLTGRQYLTPTALGAGDVVACLALPDPLVKVTHFVLVNPAKLGQVRGPRVVASGSGIEYLATDGIPPEALAIGWPLEIR